LQRSQRRRASKWEIVIAGTADPERGDRGAAVAVENGAESEAGVDECACVAKCGRLTWWAEISERRVLGGKSDEGGVHCGVKDDQDGEFRSAAQIGDKRTRPRR